MNRWVCNTFDPERIPFEAIGLSSNEKDLVISEQKEWLRDKTIGDPMPYQNFTVGDLQNRGIIGIYLE